MAQFNSNDRLDIAGDWTFNLRVNLAENFTFPPGSSSYRMHLDDAGKGSHGGQKFKGKFIDPEIVGLEFTGETFYDKRGVHLIQMLGVRKAEQYLWVLCGSHMIDTTDRRKIWICGTAFDVGHEMAPVAGGGGTPNLFEMIKLKSK